MSIRRFGVSLKNDVLKQLDELVNIERFPNRSQAIGFLVRKHMVDKKWNSNSIVAGTIVLVYDHHKRELQKQLTAIQHDFHHYILAAQHVHLDHNNCLETIAIKGPSNKLKQLADMLKGVKGIKHGDVVMSAIE